MNPLKTYISRAAKAAQVNNTAVGKVTAMTPDGRYTVQLDGGRSMMVYAAMGVYNVGDTVSIRFLSKDKRQAEIVGRTTRLLASNIIRVSR